MKNYRTFPIRSVALISLLAALQACTHKPAPPRTPAAAAKPVFEMRLMVKVGEKANALASDALARRAAEVSQQSVRYVAASGSGWHALEMVCDERAQCDQGLHRLRSQPLEFATVEPEARASFGPGLPLPAMSR